jgi:CRP/FNR family putative post-exponential-phase nitrogen-starvation transcriptional regulator
MEYLNDEKKLDYYIKKYEIKSLFSEHLFDNYYKYMSLVRFTKNEYIFLERSNLHYIYLFLSGKIKVCFLLNNGKQQLLNLITGMSIMGDLELFGISNPFLSLQTLEESYAIAIPLFFTQNYLFQDSVFLKQIGELMAKKIYSFTSNTALNMNYELINRLCSYISFMSKEITVNDTKYLYFNENLSETTELLGTSYRHLQRTLKKLQEDGIIDRYSKGYIVLDYDRLIDLSSNEYFIDGHI